ncbi:polysulfide reductase [Prauserella marina]|uniref:DMSO reductase anchor subunit n=1 Tax=Prauserella marina TaxID=530584 RepID=A0A222VQT2_9PSEU|nr:NrfD/PsrC family molybdoenzyme membrane anchor subunit [Prauserella marina]ASR36093.1 polysulfide reductase [Prauserella marina]PWV76825.1 DMSO reductase anchor subunit [Prauserella marina]SDC98438.1 DMSO reductase anchor subunit [Prauserella marina]
MTGIDPRAADATAPPEREAMTGARGRRRRKAEQAMVPDAKFGSYYGKPVLNKPTWAAADIASYLFLGGLAGASSVMAAGADLTGRRALARGCKAGALVAVSGSLYALIHDLGRPMRFVNMLRTVKPSSPMSVGSWILAGYGPQAGIAALTEVTGLLPGIGRAATIGAGMFGPAVAAYTAPLMADTAVPTWHDGYRELPFVFAGSAASAAGGWGLLIAPPGEAAPARKATIVGGALELGATSLMERRMGLSAEPLRQGTAGKLMRAAKGLTVAGAVVGGVLGRKSRAVAAVGGLASLAGAACTRFGFFHAGVASAEDPKYTVRPQRERLERERDPA